MLEEMASMGGHPVSEDNDVWTRLEKNNQGEIGKQGHIFFLAEPLEAQSDPIGFAEARVVSTAVVYDPKRILHIHAIYVVEPYRRQGIGRSLFEAMLDWGRSLGCVQAKLSVLASNPACSLYEQFGFRVFEIEMFTEL
jgi:GNAT superfamily N-acetyltransferase